MAKRLTKKEVNLLGRYWLRADLMHEYVHEMRVMYDRDLNQMREDGYWWEFETYVAYWLSALFVLVEGFNKVGVADKTVRRLFDANVGKLKRVRHETYHFGEGSTGAILPQLNWAEKLHEAIGEVIKKQVGIHERAERLLELRSKQKNKRKAQSKIPRAKK